jgi:hypothetical protein
MKGQRLYPSCMNEVRHVCWNYNYYILSRLPNRKFSKVRKQCKGVGHAGSAHGNIDSAALVRTVFPRKGRIGIEVR